MKTGDRVKCVKSHSTGLGSVNGLDYIVYNSRVCECGEQKLDIGMKIPESGQGTICRCGLLTTSEVFWHSSRLFRKVEEKVNYVKLEIEVEEPCLN